MKSPTVRPGSYPNASRATSSSKLKTYGFAIAIIVGICGLVVGATGLAGYFHAGALSNMAINQAIIMMAVGGGSGAILMILGTIGTIKNRQNGKPHKVVNVNPEHGRAAPSSVLAKPRDISSIDTHGGLVYGREAWKKWNVEILDVIPPPPVVDLSKKDKVLLFIPLNIKFNGKKQKLTLSALKEICSGSFSFFSGGVKVTLGEDNAKPGWILIDKNIIPESQGKDYETQKTMVKAKGYCMPTVLEAIILNLMVFAFTGERLYGNDPCIYTRCVEKLEICDGACVIVGNFGSDGLIVDSRNLSSDSQEFGVASVQREF